MIVRNIAIAATGIIAAFLSPVSAGAEPPHAALIVGNAVYTSLPGIVGCARSANAVSAALRALNFQVTERQDPSTGGIDAGITEFSQHLGQGNATGFIYVCGYATDFNNRTFLLPTSAAIGRPSDVMTQGVLAKTMLDTVSRDPATVAVVVFDMVPQPGGPSQIDLNALAGIAVPEGVGFIAASETTPPDGPTPVAAALVAALAGPQVRSDLLISKVQAQLRGGKTVLSTYHMPARGGFLQGGPPATEPRAPPPEAPVPSAATTPGPAIQPAVASPQAPATPQTQMPDEAQMTEFDRRQVQDALVRLGYYDRSVDAVFGPETRAAIRRYQHEIGAEMTGRLTADQATRLMSAR